MTISQTLQKAFDQKALLHFGVIPFLGSLLIALAAYIAIPLPFTSVPITMQTASISLLALHLSPVQAMLAVLFYLGEATLGYPVLAGGMSNPLWMIGPRAGYLIGFLIAAPTVSQLLNRYRPKSFGFSWLILIQTEGITLFFGGAWLTFFLGKEEGFLFGVLPFLFGAILKSLSVSCYKKGLGI